MTMNLFKTFLFIFICFVSNSQNNLSVAVLKYNGGGDYYANPTALPNLVKFCNSKLKTSINENDIPYVEAGSNDVFDYPFIHMTGHGNVVFSQPEVKNIRMYLEAGGFLHIDDNYGMKPYVLTQIQKLFPEKELKEIPSDHPLFGIHFKFPNGLPKIHEHDGLPPKALGLFHENKVILLFTTESDLGDGWEDSVVHNDPEEVRLKALKMGANIVKYAFEF